VKSRPVCGIGLSEQGKVLIFGGGGFCKFMFNSNQVVNG